MHPSGPRPPPPPTFWPLTTALLFLWYLYDCPGPFIAIILLIRHPFPAAVCCSQFTVQHSPSPSRCVPPDRYRSLIPRYPIRITHLLPRMHTSIRTLHTSQHSSFDVPLDCPGRADGVRREIVSVHLACRSGHVSHDKNPECMH
ncbi:hypothetical protein BD311DRAFT_497454 [Dichomitus squalens]|uniref:Uncharacterized protein n=1 Tax=Dichomitus squalens TaxID=114155 RepID=A0A4Q9ME53_9APHY|nr:hypothetical protein BD311DRAFT_497454 [Dichomitus squalens]